MIEYLIHTVTDTATGAIRYVIAHPDLTLGLDITETVTAREPLSSHFDAPVSIVCRRQPMDRTLRIQIENWRQEQGGAVTAVDGDELAVTFFQLGEA